MDFTNVTNGVITEYSAPSAELVEKMATPIDNADSVRRIIIDQYNASGNIDLTKIPLIQLLELPEFRELANQKFPREHRELFEEIYKLKKILDEE